MVNDKSKYFVFNGKKSSDFGVWASGSYVLDSPMKRYEQINVPGRNGALIIEDGSYENVNLEFKDCWIPEDFPNNYSALKNFLYRQNGYQRLELSWLPDEYRLAAFMGDIEPTITSWNGKGHFDMSFNCKPQRFLKSGEEPMYIIPAIPVGTTEVLSPIYDLKASDANNTKVFYITVIKAPWTTLEINERWYNPNYYSELGYHDSGPIPYTVGTRTLIRSNVNGDTGLQLIFTKDADDNLDDIIIRIEGKMYDSGKDEYIYFDGFFARDFFVTNPTDFPTKPYFKCWGATFPISWIRLEDGEGWTIVCSDYSSITTELIVDCENEYMYYFDSNGNKKNLTDYMTITHTDANNNTLMPSFPYFGSGTTELYAYGTATSHNLLVQMIPHWYTI